MPETNTKLGDYREKQIVARLPKGQGGGTIPIVIDNKKFDNEFLTQKNL